MPRPRTAAAAAGSTSSVGDSGASSASRSAATARTAGRQVVADDQLTLGVDAGDELLELQREQATVGAQLEHVVLDLGGDPGDHLQALGHHRDVAHRDEVLDLQGREGAGDLVEAQLVALEGRQRLVGPGQDLPGVLQDVAGLTDVGRDDLHRLGDRDDGETGLAGHPVGRPVPGAGLLGGDGVVGHQVHRRPQDPGDVAVEDDRAVHLGQLAQPGRGEGHVEAETTGRDRLHGLVVAQHDQRAGASAQDPLEAVPQGGAGGDRGQRGPQRGARPLVRWPPSRSSAVAATRPWGRV